MKYLVPVNSFEDLCYDSVMAIEFWRWTSNSIVLISFLLNNQVIETNKKKKKKENKN